MRDRLSIVEGGLDRPEVVGLLREHLDDMKAVTPPQSVHALDIEQLLATDVSFWSVWDGNELVAVGALKQVDSDGGELKSMRTTRTRRGQGVASRLLEHIEAEGRKRGYRTLSLETGALPEFASARSFYEHHGFSRCGPFGDYTEDPNSAFMTKRLEPAIR